MNVGKHFFPSRDDKENRPGDVLEDIYASKIAALRTHPSTYVETRVCKDRANELCTIPFPD